MVWAAIPRHARYTTRADGPADRAAGRLCLGYRSARDGEVEPELPCNVPINVGGGATNMGLARWYSNWGKAGFAPMASFG